MISGQIDQLATALAKAQGEIQAAKLDGNNPHFKSKYGTLSSFWDSIRAPLSKHGLAVSQVVDAEHGELVTILMHSSGQYLTSHYTLRPQQDTPQGWGSAMTYARRYCLAAIVGAVADDDDDGNEASKRKVNQATGEVEEPPQSNGHKPAPTVGAATEGTLRRMNQLGSQFYGRDWDTMRHDLCGWASNGRTKTSREITEVEAAKIIRGIELKIEKAKADFAKAAEPAPSNGSQESLLEEAAAANPGSAYGKGI